MDRYGDHVLTGLPADLENPGFDWGTVDSSWIRDVPNDGLFVNYENITRKASRALILQQKPFSGCSRVAANNVPSLPFFRMFYLWDAECEAQIGSLDQAETYVKNMVRQRAAIRRV